MARHALVKRLHPETHPHAYFEEDCNSSYELRKLDDMSLAILKLLSRFRLSHQIATSEYLWKSYLSKSFPAYTYKQLMSRIQKLSRAKLIVRYYKETPVMLVKAHWKITEEGLRRIYSSPV